jgi:hypothetical protein
MKTKYSREHLLKELEEALALAGPHPRRWRAACCARLSAFVERDGEAARLFAEAKALERVLCCAPEGKPRSALEGCILRAAFQLPQCRSAGASSGFDIGLGGVGRGFRSRMQHIPFRIPSRSFWGEAALLAASLALGVYIGMSGEVVPALRDLDVMASTDGDASMAFSSSLSLFEQSGLQDQEQL